MVGTVGAARKLGGGWGLAASGIAYAAGLLLGAAVVFGALGAAAASLRPGRGWLVAVSALAVAAALADALGWRVRPQVPFQVPERWRTTLPLPLALFLYGCLLGTGVTTYVPAVAAWALILLGVALGNPVAPLLVGLALAVGRAVPVLALALRDDGTWLAERPVGLRVVRALAGVALATAAAVALVGSAGAGIVAVAEDPSVAAGDLAWQQPGVGGFLRRAGQSPVRLPGADPAIGGALVAWHAGDHVTVADRPTLEQVYEGTVPGVQKLAVDDTWLVYGTVDSQGGQRIVAESLADHSRREIATARWPAQLGRPSLTGTRVVYHVATRRGSWITLVDLANGRRRRLRSSNGDLVTNPALLGETLLYVRVTRCAQLLEVGGLAGGDRTLAVLPPLAGQDAGHERGHTTQGEAIPCPGTPHPTRMTYWTTALTSRYAYVTRLHPGSNGRTVPMLLRLDRR